MTFSKGDTVIVKSGGPALTVLSTDEDHVTCLFFSEELGEFKQTVIPAFALEMYEDASDMDEDEEEEEEDEDEEDEDEEPSKGSKKVA